jgi:tetratricopeptide (TPR) repeat protein
MVSLFRHVQASRPRILGFTVAAVAAVVLVGTATARRRTAPPASLPAALTLSEIQAQVETKPSADGFLLLIRHCVQEGKTQDAVAAAKRALERYPRSAEIHNASGIAYASAGDPALARKHFNESIALNPRAVDPYVNLGRAALVYRDVQAALSYFDLATTVDPNSAAAWAGVGEAAIELKYERQARDSLEKAIQLAPNDPGAYATLGCFLAESEYGGEARPLLEKAVSLGHRSGKVYSSLTMACADQPKSDADLRQALDYAAEAEKLGDASALLYYGRGLALQRLALYEEAVKSFRAVIDRTLTSHGAWIGIAQCYRALGKRELSDKAAEMGERVLNERQRVGNLRHQIRANPERFELREQYAAELMKRGEFLPAAEEYRYVAQHRPDHPREWLKAADAFERGGEAEIARYLRDFVRAEEKRQASGQAPSGPAVYAPSKQ